MLSKKDLDNFKALGFFGSKKIQESESPFPCNHLLKEQIVLKSGVKLDILESRNVVEYYIVPQEYQVEWKIDISATSPEEAAKIALEIQQDVRSQSTVFDVYETVTPGRKHYRVDLDADESSYRRIVRI